MHNNSKLQLVKSICKSRNLRLTKDRLALYELISNSQKPIKAYDLLHKFKMIKANVKPPIIYRALNFLEEHGFIHKINIINKYFACSHLGDQHSCQLFLCTKCHEATEFCNNDTSQKLKLEAAKHKFLPQKISVEILGVCKKCQK